MSEWWGAMTVAQQIFACVAIPATVVLIVQTVLLLFGIGGHADGDHGGASDMHMTDMHMTDMHMADMHMAGVHGAGVDVNGDGIVDSVDMNGDGVIDSVSHMGGDHLSSGLSLFTIRGLVAFFAVGGWLGVLLLYTQMPVWLSIIISFAAGFAAMLSIALIFKASMKLQHSGNMDIRNAVGRTGQVYLTVPGNGSGVGKVNVTFQEQLTELSAITWESEPIPTGAYVTVEKLVDGETVSVKRI